MPETAFKGSALAKARSGVAVAYRRKDTTPAAIEEARRRFAEEKIAAYITRVVDQAPPFTPEQVDRLRVLLEPVRRGGAAT